MKQAFVNVCRKNECFDFMQKSCDKILPCGHACCGVALEKQCLPCLFPECIEKNPVVKAKIKCNNEDFCSICYSANVGQEPSIMLDCGHVYHFNCIE